MPAKKTKPKSNSPLTVGKTLKARRLERDLSLKDVERATRIRGKYLLALEADNYTELANDIYTKGFVQSYAEFLDLDGRDLAKRYAGERGKQELKMRRISSVSAPRFVLTPRRLTLVGGSLAAIGIAAYLTSQLSVLTAPPKLEVQNPSHDQVLYGSLISVSGHVAGGADVFVNDSPILVDGNGNFSDSIALQDGVNSIRVTAKSRLGKSATVTRNILAHVPKTDPASLLPTAPFDGVAVSVQTQGSAATVTVTIDGKRAFRGTMLPGTNQTFKGTQRVEIATSNAGATTLKVTNATTANKDLGALGSNNQPKNDFEFDKDTNFQ